MPATISRSEFASGIEDSRYLELAPQLKYYLTQNHYLQLLYEYGRQEIEKPLTETIERNLIQLTLGLAFPRKL